MRYAYIVLTNSNHRPDERGLFSPNVNPQAAGMDLRTTLSTVIIFASSSTPTIQMPGGGTIIGDLYSRSGTAIKVGSQLGRLPTSTQAVRRHIIENYWGDYVLVQQGEKDPHAVSVMRSPSPVSDLQCVYSLHNGAGFVTSDISLATRLGLCHRHVDLDYIVHRLTYPGMKTSRTGLAGISELLPGCTISLRDNHIVRSQDWCPWNFVDSQARHRDQKEAALAVRRETELVVTAWADQDRSVLLELSGGVDSSIVGVCLKNSRAVVTCSTLTTPGPGADEREYASLITGVLGVELLARELQYDDAQFMFPPMPQLVTPVIGPLQYAIDKIMRHTADQHDVGSHFTGAGGDTIFCYLTNAAPAADAFRGAGLSTGIQTVQDISRFHQCTYWKAGRLTLRKLVRPEKDQYEIDRTLLSASAYMPAPEHHPWLRAPAKSLLGDRQRIFKLSATQFFRDSCPRGLNRRVRIPLLSQPVIEACLRTPSWMWFSGGQNRAIARRAFAHVLPQRVLARRSKGTFTAFLGGLYRRNRHQMIDFLLDGELQAHRLLDADKLRRIAGEHSYDRETILRVFLLCTLENWIRHQPIHSSGRGDADALASLSRISRQRAY